MPNGSCYALVTHLLAKWVLTVRFVHDSVLRGKNGVVIDNDIVKFLSELSHMVMNVTLNSFMDRFSLIIQRYCWLLHENTINLWDLPS